MRQARRCGGILNAVRAKAFPLPFFVASVEGQTRSTPKQTCTPRPSHVVYGGTAIEARRPHRVENGEGLVTTVMTRVHTMGRTIDIYAFKLKRPGVAPSWLGSLTVEIPGEGTLPLAWTRLPGDRLCICLGQVAASMRTHGGAAAHRLTDVVEALILAGAGLGLSN